MSNLNLKTGRFETRCFETWRFVNLTFCIPDVLKPDVLKRNVLKPDVLWVYPVLYCDRPQVEMLLKIQYMHFKLSSATHDLSKTSMAIFGLFVFRVWQWVRPWWLTGGWWSVSSPPPPSQPALTWTGRGPPLLRPLQEIRSEQKVLCW